MKKIRIGVMGAYRGTSMINYCESADNAQVVAICDKWVEGLERQKAALNDADISYYTDFDDFILHDMDAVVLANYATEHAPFAIKAMKAGKHVFSEVLPVQTMKEAVELIETVEETGKIYAYGENYCYMPAPYEMRRLYKAGTIGEFEYGECEYIHNCESIWPSITYGEEDHWRNNMYATYYCTHSLGPMIHMTGLRPVSVIGLEGTMAERKRRVGSKSGSFGIEMVTLENGGIIKSIHGGLYKNSIWYSAYGSHGRMESAREDTGEGVDRIYVNADTYSGEYAPQNIKSYKPEETNSDESAAFGHGGSDYYTMYNFVRRILGDDSADIIDVYEAMDMFLPGLFAYRSVLNGGVSMKIPDLRDKSERDKWRNDVACTDPVIAGDALLPTCSTGTPEIDKEVYEKMYSLWRKDFEADDGYTIMAMNQGRKKNDK